MCFLYLRVETYALLEKLHLAASALNILVYFLPKLLVIVIVGAGVLILVCFVFLQLLVERFVPLRGFERHAAEQDSPNH